MKDLDVAIGISVGGGVAKFAEAYLFYDWSMRASIVIGIIFCVMCFAILYTIARMR